MKKLATVFLLLNVLLASCSDDDNRPTPDAAQPGKPYTVSGTVKDGSGNPISNARIRIENPNGNNIHYTTTSNNAGQYSITVSAIGGYKIYAWKEATTENATYQVRLGMESNSDYDAFNVPASGVTKNFVWKLNGRIPDRVVSNENGSGYFGGTVKFINYNSFSDQMAPGTEVTITLTPAAGAKFLDGTSAAGRTVEKRFTIVDGVGQAYYINDIPATQYTITATCRKDGSNKLVYIGAGNPDAFTPNAEYYFRPESGSGSYESGLGSPNEHYFYMRMMSN
ncbi:carboxypeptidase-like regulatory domain-containing protein [Flavobacterium sp.]|uniref:carboxypeptidase-like regulatory domain-containing protein n=1 Tax=Flavobacterium sp. TaxID=239 RepID=UPI0039E378B4